MTKSREISIFKTSVATHTDIFAVSSLLNAMVGKNHWNFDLEDCDNILRINAPVEINPFLCQELLKMGIQCEELY